MRCRSTLFLLALSALPATLGAQDTCPALQAGSTVRLHAPRAATYVLPQPVRPSDTQIVLPAHARARTVRCADLDRVQLQVSPGSRGRSTLRGAGIGLLVGAATGAALGYFGTEEDDSGWEILSREEVAGIGAVIVGGTGALVGGVIGYTTSGSRWQDVPLTTRTARVPAEGLRIAPAGGSGVQASYTLRF